MDILDKLETQERANRGALVREYREILLRLDSPQDGDAQRLANLAGRLDKRAADVRSDSDVLQQEAPLGTKAADLDAAYEAMTQAAKAETAFSKWMGRAVSSARSRRQISSISRSRV